MKNQKNIKLLITLFSVGFIIFLITAFHGYKMHVGGGESLRSLIVLFIEGPLFLILGIGGFIRCVKLYKAGYKNFFLIINFLLSLFFISTVFPTVLSWQVGNSFAEARYQKEINIRIENRNKLAFVFANDLKKANITIVGVYKNYLLYKIPYTHGNERGEYSGIAKILSNEHAEKVEKYLNENKDRHSYRMELSKQYLYAGYYNTLGNFFIHGVGIGSDEYQTEMSEEGSKLIEKYVPPMVKSRQADDEIFFYYKNTPLTVATDISVTLYEDGEEIDINKLL